jgi:hypothetical protein
MARLKCVFYIPEDDVTLQQFWQGLPDGQRSHLMRELLRAHVSEAAPLPAPGMGPGAGLDRAVLREELATAVEALRGMWGSTAAVVASGATGEESLEFMPEVASELWDD